MQESLDNKMRSPFIPGSSQSGTPKGHVYGELDLQQFPDGPFRDFYTYWLGLKENTQVPENEAFDILDLPHLVQDISLVEHREDRLFVRYSGTNFTDETGQDLTGLFMDELPNFTGMEERARLCLKTGEPYVVMDHPVTWTSRDFKKYSTLVVPLTDAAHKVVRLAYIMTYS